MNIVTTTAAWPVLGSAPRTSPAPDAAQTAPAASSALASAATAPVAGPRPHHHEHDDDDGERSGHHDQHAYLTLKLKVEQTFSALTTPGTGAANPDAAVPDANAEAEAETESGGGFAAMLKARFSLTEGGLSASLSIRMSTEGQASGDLATQMQGFVQTLYAALHTLFGGAPANPNTTLGTPVSTGAAAALPSASTPAASAESPAVPAAATPASALTDTVATVPAVQTPSPTDETTGTAPAAGTAPAGSASLSIRVRLAYNSFGSQLGSLTQQLAQPGAANAAPGMAGLLEELSTRFGQMLSQTSIGSAPTLADFLSALAQSFADPQANPAAPAPASPTPSGEAPAATTNLPAAANPASAYGQVLAFSASVRGQWLLAA